MKEKKILIVEDQLIYQIIFRNLLNKLFNITFASNGLEAIELLKSDTFHMILMDLQLPEMNGRTTFIEIRRNNLSVAPIIAVSSYATIHDQKDLLELGFVDFIPKPIKAKALLGSIITHFQSQNLKEKNNPFLGILDEKVISQLQKFNSSENLYQIFLNFIKESKLQIDEIKKSILDCQKEKIIEQIHLLKGNSGTLGIIKVFNEASSIELFLRKRTDKSLNFNILNLEKELAIFKEFIINNPKIFTNEFS